VGSSTIDDLGCSTMLYMYDSKKWGLKLTQLTNAGAGITAT